MLYRGALESANLIKVGLVTTAAMLAICLLALVETTKTAEAEDPLPQNGKIAFGSRGNIYTVEPDGSNLRLLTDGSDPNWSPDGTEILFRGSVGNFAVMSADGSNMRSITYAGVDGYYPTWSADGTSVALSKRHLGEKGESIDNDIFMVDLDNSNQTNLRKTPKINELQADFSPDGSQICFTHVDVYIPGSKPSGIYVMDVHRSDPTLLFEDVSQGQCDWSPDGKKIVFSATGDYQQKARKAEVYVINADGSGLTNLTSNSAADVEPDWSPDGTKITFNSDRDGGYDIYTMDADGSDVAQVTHLPGDDYAPDWQPLPGTTGVHQPDTGGLSLLLVAIALLFSGGVMFYADVRRRM
jgi:Tol biopolymer transport system component